MEFASMAIQKVWVLRVDPGEDVLESIRRFVTEASIRQAIVLGGYGTLAAYHLHWVTHNRIPTDNAFGQGESGVEILAMNGLVVDGEPHIHVTLSTMGGAFGGHMEPGCTAYVLCELFFAELAGVVLSRQRIPIAVEGMGEGQVSRLFFDQAQVPSS
jgi:predicted DNA-binding protein with PD1-like motif